MINISANLSRELGMVPGGEFRRAVVEVLLLYKFIFYTLYLYGLSIKIHSYLFFMNL